MEKLAPNDLPIGIQIQHVVKVLNFLDARALVPFRAAVSRVDDVHCHFYLLWRVLGGGSCISVGGIVPLFLTWFSFNTEWMLTSTKPIGDNGVKRCRTDGGFVLTGKDNVFVVDVQLGKQGFDVGR